MECFTPVVSREFLEKFHQNTIEEYDKCYGPTEGDAPLCHKCEIKRAVIDEFLEKGFFNFNEDKKTWYLTWTFKIFPKDD